MMEWMNKTKTREGPPWLINVEEFKKAIDNFSVDGMVTIEDL